jgi:hypothetical protein
VSSTRRIRAGSSERQGAQDAASASRILDPVEGLDLSSLVLVERELAHSRE